MTLDSCGKCVESSKWSLDLFPPLFGAIGGANTVDAPTLYLYCDLMYIAFALVGPVMKANPALSEAFTAVQLIMQVVVEIFS